MNFRDTLLNDASRRLQETLDALEARTPIPVLRELQGHTQDLRAWIQAQLASARRR